MRYITLADGKASYLYDLEKDRITDNYVYLAKHSLRMQVYDPDTRSTTGHFATNDKQLQDRILAAIRNKYGHISNDNAWIRPITSRHEFRDVSEERRMVLDDLKSYYGNSVTIRAILRRKIYYLSDGKLRSTPDAIGIKFGQPLVFKGVAIATIFDIDNLDPLSPDKNVVYWLTKPMWDGFHTGYRKAPRDFPWPTGFLATKWCQREGYNTYGDGEIHIASMSQGQTVGSWAATSLRQYWNARQGNDIFAKYGQTYSPKQLGEKNNMGSVIYLMRAEDSPLHYICMYCTKCNALLTVPYGLCKKCGWNCSTYDLNGKMLCKNCGLQETKVCNCGNPDCKYNGTLHCKCEKPDFVTPSSEEHSAQYNHLHGLPKKWEDVYGNIDLTKGKEEKEYVF